MMLIEAKYSGNGWLRFWCQALKQLTQEAWVKGTKVKPDGSVRTYDFNKPIGANGETKVKVHMDKKGNIHGYPVK